MLSCLHPRVVFNKYLGDYVTVPCRSCDACRCLLSNSWTNRLELECKQHRYTIFGTLTYTDDKLPLISVNDLSFVPNLSDLISSSSEFITFNSGFLPYCRTQDFQRFIKNLRGYVRQLHLPKGEGLLRYFANYEYGPTTFRPHIHYLLWFDAPELYPVIKSYIFKAWKFANSCSTPAAFFNRNKTKFVDFRCCRYVAGYLNCFSHLPAVLTHPDIRAKHLQSQAPPIGVASLEFSQIQSVIFGDACKVTIERPSAHQYVSVSLWCSLENRYLPKCPGFAYLSHTDRVTLYNVFVTAGCPSSYKLFKQWILSKWHDTSLLFVVLRRVLSSVYSVGSLRKTRDLAESALRRLFFLSKRVNSFCSDWRISLSDYVQRIESYYVRKDYYNLCCQLTFEQEVADSSNISNSSLCYLPFLIDLQFYENFRHLRPLSYASYLNQFSVIGDDFWNYLPSFSFQWQCQCSLFQRIRSDNTKVRVKKEYVALHPEYEQIYLQNLFHNL